MIRDILHKTAIENGFNFRTGFKEEIIEHTLSFPLLWFEEPEISIKNGNTNLCTCKINGYIIDADYGNNNFSDLTDSVFNILESIKSSPQLLKLNNIKVTANKYPLTNFGDISLNFSLELTIINS
ncbi:MAG: hypothetical protein LUF90_08005 [Rikenellaceae bacterium]|nr:hypothetical protein [Rikenellaceae bacterium]